jgi:hypothetical protein
VQRKGRAEAQASPRNPSTHKEQRNMTRVRLVVIAAMALFAFGAVSASMAQAEALAPEVLCLENCAKTIEATFKGLASELSTLGGLALTGETVKGTLTLCKPLEGNEKDFNLCEPVLLTFTGVKQKKVACRSEMGNGEEKDVIETVLVATDLHLASEETSGGVLQPLVLFKVLGALPGEESNELTINCGGVKNKVKGTIGCLLSNGLENIPTTKEVTLACELNASHDAVTGKCEVLCEWLTTAPFLSNLGNGFEDAWMKVSATGKFNKDVFIDD